MEVDILAVIGMAIPIVVLFAATILAMTFTHLLLSAKGNQYRTEASGIFGVVIFVIGEYILEIFQIPLTLFMIILVTPFMLVEAVRPSTGNQLTPPVLLDIKEYAGELASEVICVVQGKVYVGLAAIRVQGIPMESKATSESELKLLLPLWENGKRSGTTYTLEAKIENGVVDLVVFVIDQDTDWKVSVEKAWQSKHVVESWVKQMDYSYSVLDFIQLSTAYQELESKPNMGIASPTVAGFDGRYFGIISVDGMTKDLSCSIEQVLNNLLDGDLSGRVMFSFSSASLPRFGGEVAKLKSAEGQSRTPYRVEEHQLRPIYKQMAEIEACEETGAFRAGVSVIIEGTHCEEVENKMKLIEAMIKGAWSGVKVTISSAAQAIRGWDRILLKRPYGTTTPVSGARLIGLIDVSGPLPGISGRSLPPEFILPVYESDSNDMISLGYHLRKRKLTHQMHRIHKDEFTTHTLIVGNPGGGKTNSARHLVHELHRKGIPYLVITPTKTEWRQLVSKVPTQRIFTLGDESTAPFRFNFFDVPEGVPIRTHIDNIITCFVASWPSEGILAEHIAKVFKRVYANKGWDVLNNMRGRPILLTDLYHAMEQVAGELEYGSRLSQDFVGALKARFESLVGDEVLAVMFNTEQGLTIPILLNHQTVLEIRGFTDEKTAFISSLILTGVSEYLDAKETPLKQELKHLLVLEEAHHVLKRVDVQSLDAGHSSQQQAINTIVRLLREARGLGLGLMLIDQMPKDLAPAAVKLPGITIIHNLKTPEERAIVGGQANLNEEQMFYIGVLEVGEAIVHQGFSQHAVNIKVEHCQLAESKDSHSWNDHAISELMKPFYEKNNHLVIQNLPTIDSWRPNPIILRNLEGLTESDKFVERYDEFVNPKSGLAKYVIERLLRKHNVSTDPRETDRYVSLFIDYAANLERCSDERT